MFSAFVWLSCCWSRTCAWWYLRVQKIFVYDANDITRQNDITSQLYRKIIRGKKIPHTEATRLKTQKVITIIYVRFKVTICLYLVFAWRATRMREFPVNAAMERRMSTAKKQISSCWYPPIKEGEHSSSSYDFVWLLPLLKFVVDIILSSAFLLRPSWQSHNKFSVE